DGADRVAECASQGHPTGDHRDTPCAVQTLLERRLWCLGASILGLAGVVWACSCLGSFHRWACRRDTCARVRLRIALPRTFSCRLIVLHPQHGTATLDAPREKITGRTPWGQLRRRGDSPCGSAQPSVASYR